MTSTGPGDIQRCVPYFPVGVGRWYRDVLGFGCEYSAGEPPEFAIYSRDGCGIMLRRVAAPERIRPNEAQGGTWDAFFWVRDVEALHAEMAARGAEVVYAPMVQPYGMKEFAVRDPQGHVLGFGQHRESI